MNGEWGKIGDITSFVSTLSPPSLGVRKNAPALLDDRNTGVRITRVLLAKRQLLLAWKLLRPSKAGIRSVI